MAKLTWRQIGRRLSPPFVALLRPWFTPTEITVAGATCGVAGGILLGVGAWIPALVLCLICAACDWIDGELARATHQTTPFGAILDSVLDRVSDCAPLAGVMAFFAKEGQPLGAIVAGLALLASILIPYAKARIEAIGFGVEVGILSRVPRQILFLLGIVFGATATVWVLIVISAFGAITVIQRLRFIQAKLAAI